MGKAGFWANWAFIRLDNLFQVQSAEKRYGEFGEIHQREIIIFSSKQTLIYLTPQ
jgi:hypothetical protein